MADTVLITTYDLEPAVRLRDAFEAAGLAVELVTPGERIADVSDPALLVLSGGLEEKQARRLVREAADYEHLPVIGLADQPGQTTAEARWQLGLTRAFVKPADIGVVADIGQRLIQRTRLRRITGIVGETDGMMDALERVVQVAPVSTTVLITGESGTGKERIARGIHALSRRAGRAFVAANVAALPETLLESELFGHEKGSFTGAVGQRKGFFELANRGTLFLDEIGEMPLATQTKLLRVLEEREFMRVGGETPISVDVRVIAATNQNLRALVEVGRFRHDLFFRLNVLHIDLPPLRERRDDIPLLVDAFVAQTSKDLGRPPISIAPETMQVLLRYDWPGNVREMKNLIESMVVMAPGTRIRPGDLPSEIRDGANGRSRLLPVPIPRLAERKDGTPTPELEFVFRTLLQMRIDIEDLRTQFDEYRRTQALPSVPPPPFAYPAFGTALTAGVAGAGVGTGRNFGNAGSHTGGRALEHLDIEDVEAEDERAVVVYRPGMTLQEIEKAAIVAALKDVGGNRRKAAEMLGMGERTLYRKIKEYDIPL
ncbi:MAG: sigma-54 interaction domain-containing protein [Longimicrobiales bacterium]